MWKSLYSGVEIMRNFLDFFVCLLREKEQGWEKKLEEIDTISKSLKEMRERVD